MIFRKVVSASIALVGLLGSQAPALAAPPYQNTSPIAISEANFPCTGTLLTRPIVVSDSFIIGDVDLGLQVNHTYRGDLRISLTSPAGTNVQMVNNDGGNGADNYNVRFNDESGVLVNTGTHAGNDPTTPQYISNVRPQNALSAFNGQNASGTWTVTLCDAFNGDSGNYISSELFFAAPDPSDPPILSCGASVQRHDWDTNPWPAGSLTQTYSPVGDDMRVTVSGATGSLLADPETSASTPVTSTYYTGGNGTAQNALFMLANHPSSASAITVTLDVGDLPAGAANQGVDELQFSLLDLDFGTGAFQDRVTVTGTNGASSVTPVMTPNAANSATGNVATGTASAGQDSVDGTVTVTFSSPVTSVTITYGNGPLAPANPGNQGISIYDVLTCPRTNAVLEAGKTNRIADDLYALPGNDVIYTITVANTGTGPTDSDSIVLIDSMPPEVEFLSPAGNDSVTFTETGATGLDFTFGTAVGFSNATTKPTTFAQCTYAPVNGYDPAVTYICFNPKDEMAAGTSFAMEFRARIK